MSAPRPITLQEAAQIKRAGKISRATDALQAAIRVIENEDAILDDFAIVDPADETAAAFAQVALVVAGMACVDALPHCALTFAFQTPGERRGLLAIKDAADRLLNYSAVTIDTE